MNAIVPQYALCALALVVLTACGKKEDTTTPTAPGTEPVTATKPSPEQPGPHATPLDPFTRHHAKKVQTASAPSGPSPQAFLEALPVTLGGMQQVRTSATRVLHQGQYHTQAEAVFQDRRARTLFLRLVERSLLKGWSADTIALAGKANVEMADAGGYTRSGTFQDYPSVERYRKQINASQVNVAVGEILVVECRGINMDPETLRTQLEQWPLQELHALEHALQAPRTAAEDS